MMNAFLGVLDDLGEGTTRHFLRDNPTWREYTRMMLLTVRRHPWVLPALRTALGTRGLRSGAAGPHGRLHFAPGNGSGARCTVPVRCDISLEVALNR